MQHKLMVLLTALVLWSLLLKPASSAGARAQAAEPHCPAYRPGLLQEKEFLNTLPRECIQFYKQAARQANPGAQADLQPAPSAPDSFGYTYDDAVTYSWVSAATKTSLTGDDTFSSPLDIGFSFPFYGVRYSQLYFNTNGLITFGSGSSEYGSRWSLFPSDRNPNNFIAPFWDDLLVGAPNNSGAIYYSRGGVAPNRYFVIEWRGVENYDGTGTFSFEAILYETGNILFQYQSVPSEYEPMVAIEGINGLQGLKYEYRPSPFKTIRFYYPVTLAARVLAYATQPGGFVPLGSYKDFAIVVINQGNLGADRFDLTSAASAWPVTYYAANGTTPLTDTDGDGKLDTGPILAGASTTIFARYRTPLGVEVGDDHSHQIQLTSSITGSVSTSVNLAMTISAGFVNGFTDFSNSAMSFLKASAEGTNTYKATANGYSGYDAAVTKLMNGNYLYAWDKYYPGASHGWRNIEYVIFGPGGNLVLPMQKLTNNSGTSIYTDDDLASVAVAPNGTVGVVWTRYLHNATTGKHNYNIYFATLNAAGTRLTGPTNLTNNTTWGTWSEDNIPELDYSTIAATSDNRFVIAWADSRKVNGDYQDNIWYAVRNTSGASVKAPMDLTGDGASWHPVLDTLTGGKVILTWSTAYYEIYYAVLNSSGIINFFSSLGSEAYDWGDHDAVQLPNGKVAIAWASGTGVNFSILNSSYIPEGGIYTRNTDGPGDNISVTTDAASHVIMTWVAGNYTKLFYALGGGNGGYLTDPMPYHISGDYISMSRNGQGMAPYQGNPVISGNAGVAAATLNYTGGSTTANGDGKYSFLVPLGWSGTVTPVKANYTFTPANRAYTNVLADKSAQNFTAVTYSISGNTGVGGVTLSYVNGGPETVTSQMDGSYSFQVPQGWSGTVTPSMTDYRFSPANRTYSNVTANQTGQDYTAIPLYEISGNVGVAGVVLSYTDDTAKTVTSKADGSYTLSVPNGWSGTVIPTHACYTFDPSDRSYANVTSDLSAQDHTPSFAGGSGCADIDISVGGASQARFGLQPQGSTRASFSGLNNGPVQIESTNAVPLIAAERVVYKVNGVNTSFTEMMGLPNNQLDTVYWLPWYNNVELDTQLRFANVSDSNATVHIYIGEEEMTGSPFTLLAGESARKSFPGVSAGPVKIESDVNIVAAERIVYKVNGVGESFTEMMALPNSQLDTTYYFPWYNNVELDTQLRFANASDTPATIQITIGGEEMPGSPFTLEPGASTRQSFVGINDGPVKIESDVPIVAAERVVYKVNGINTSFIETMGLPAKQLDTTYWLPWYNNVELDTQLRFANVSDTPASVHVYIGGQEMTGSPFTLEPGASTRQSFAGINAGPVRIVSDVPIVAAERVVYRVNGVGTSFSEMMGLPNGLLDPVYWLPCYNNVELDTQLRFGTP